ncbi:MAG: DMT family transporter [Armatimonadota bacterium]
MPWRRPLVFDAATEPTSPERTAESEQGMQNPSYGHPRMTEALADSNTPAAEPDFGARRFTPGAVALSVMISIFWATNPTALKLALRGFPPIGSAGLRFAIAAIGVWGWCAATRVRAWPRPGELRWLAVVGAFFTAQIATFSLGVYLGTASHSIVILHTYPFFVVALAHFLIPGDRATPGRIAGLVAAFTGVLALFIGDWGGWHGRQFLGDAVQLLSALVLGAQIVYTKHAVARIDSDRVVLWQMLIGAPLFLAYSLIFEHLAGVRPPALSIAAVVYQGLVIGTLCFTIWTFLIRRHSASAVAIFGFIAPVVGVFLSALVLGEPLSPSLLLSAGLVAAGIVLANIW